MGTTNPLNYTNPIAITTGGTGQITKAAAFNALSPNSTKGDLICYSGTHNVSLAVGTNGQFMTADSSATNGIKWAAGAAASSVGLTSSQFTVASTPVTATGTMTINLPASMPGKNLLLNGDVSLWQRTTGGTGSIAIAASQTNAYTADQWDVTTPANCASVVSQQAGSTTGRYYLRVQRNSGQTGTSATRLSQSLTLSQSVDIASTVVTISFVGLCGANFSPTSSNITVAVNTGTGTTDAVGAPTFASGNAAVISQTATLTTSAQTFTYTSSTIGSTATQIALVISWSTTGTAGANDWAEFGDLQLEIAPQATPFERKSFQQNLKECMYYYQKSFNYAVSPAQNAGTSTGEVYLVATNAAAAANKGILQPFIRPIKGSTSNLTFFNPSAANAQMRDLTVPGDCSATAKTNAATYGMLIACTGNLSTLFGDRYIIHYTYTNSLQ